VNFDWKNSGAAGRFLSGCFLAGRLYNRGMETDQKKLKKGANELGIRMAILFGSRAGGKARLDSGYDIAVLTSNEKNIGKNMENYNSILFFLCDALGIPDSKFDLTNLNDASPALNYEIFRKGRLLYGNATEFAAFQAYAMREHIATRSLRELQEKLIHIRQKKLAEEIYA
jgi:predicted nucleotidyltransferase